MLETSQATLLERALTANAWFSRFSGLALAVFSPWLADFAGVETWVLVLVGLCLIGYSLWLGAVAARRPTNRTEAMVAIAGDEAWVVAAIVIIFVFPDALTTGGKLVLGLTTIVVALFATAQVIGLRRPEAG